MAGSLTVVLMVRFLFLGGAEEDAVGQDRGEGLHGDHTLLVAPGVKKGKLTELIYEARHTAGLLMNACNGFFVELATISSHNGEPVTDIGVSTSIVLR